MQTITKNLLNPVANDKGEYAVLTAKYAEAESLGEIESVVTAMGLTLPQVNEALRGLKRDLYVTALSQGVTADQKIANVMATLVQNGFSADEAKTIAESKRAQYEKQGLPDGLAYKVDAENKQVFGKRKGRKASK